MQDYEASERLLKVCSIRSWVKKGNNCTNFHKQADRGTPTGSSAWITINSRYSVNIKTASQKQCISKNKHKPNNICAIVSDAKNSFTVNVELDKLNHN